jgi:hypothetical protein
LRKLVDVIDQMLEQIPATEVELIRALEDNRSSAAIAAPETRLFRWQNTAETLADHLGDVLQTEGWKKQVQDIFMDRAGFAPREEDES